MKSKYGFIYNPEVHICEKRGYRLLKTVFTPSIYWSDFSLSGGYASGEHPGWSFDGLYQVNDQDFMHYHSSYFSEHKVSQSVENIGLLNREEAVKWWQHMDEWNFHLTHNKETRECWDIGFDEAFGLTGGALKK